MTNLAKSFNSASFFLSIFVERWNCAVGFRVRHNGWRVGDVALCCPACAGARQYRLHAVSGWVFIYFQLV